MSTRGLTKPPSWKESLERQLLLTSTKMKSMFWNGNQSSSKRAGKESTVKAALIDPKTSSGIVLSPSKVNVAADIPDADLIAEEIAWRYVFEHLFLIIIEIYH